MKMLEIPKENLEALKLHPEYFFSVSYKKGEQIYKQGTPVTHLVFVEKGLMKVHFEYLQKQLVLLLLKPGEMIGSPGFLTDNKHHFSVTTLEDSTVWLLDLHFYKEKLESESGFAVNIIRYLNLLHQKTYKRLLSLTLKSMYGRVADTLLYLADDFYGSTVFDTTLSRQDIADFAGLSMESVVRILSAFSNDELIICEGKHFEIINRDKLEQME